MCVCVKCVCFFYITSHPPNLCALVVVRARHVCFTIVVAARPEEREYLKFLNKKKRLHSADFRFFLTPLLL